MTDYEAIRDLVERYKKAIHTQNKEDFISLWTGEEGNTLISIANPFRGITSIYEDFLIGGIQTLYQQIDIIGESFEVNFLDQQTAIVIFRYHTECIRRGSGEPHGIAGIETQVVVKRGEKWKLAHVHYSKE